MGRCPITNQVARKALRKLEAEDITPKGAAHPKFGIVYEGVIVSSTGLRRSSKRDIPLPHVTTDLRVNTAFVLDLARCPKSRDDYLRAIDALPSEDAVGQSEPEASG